MDFFFAAENIPFAVALLVMLFIAILEGVLVLIGAGFSEVLENLVPDIELDTDISTPNSVSRVLAWLRVGQVPVLILLIIFLTSFGVTGFTLQHILNDSINWMLPAILASIPALAVSLPATRMLGGLLGKLVIKDETQAINKKDFIGQVVTITLGTSSRGSAAEARFRDRFGTTHYVMVEPDTDAEFSQGEQLLLVRQQGSTFFGIPAGNQNLTD